MACHKAAMGIALFRNPLDCGGGVAGLFALEQLR